MRPSALAFLLAVAACTSSEPDCSPPFTEYGEYKIFTEDGAEAGSVFIDVDRAIWTRVVDGEEIVATYENDPF